MSVEHELTQFLYNNLKDGANKSRDIKIILHFYGFKGEIWPTLEETAGHFGINTRERVRQIIQKKFKDIATFRDIPTLKRYSEILESRSYWLDDELLYKVKQELDDDFSVRGVFNLMADLDMHHGYEIYTPNLKKASRATIDRYEYNFVISDGVFKLIRVLFNKALRSPSTYGITSFSSLKEKNQDFAEHENVIKKLISASEHSWTKYYQNDFWFIIEDRDNTLVNYSEKVFSVINQCDSDRLAETYLKALVGRQSKKNLPPIELIKEYLESSIYLENNEGMLSFIGEKRALNDIDIDIVEYLNENLEVSFPVFSKYLVNKGYGVSHVTKILTSSPLIYIDKSKGRHHYVYSLIGSIEVANVKLDEGVERYKKFLIRLRKIAVLGTDETVEYKRRREQDILQNWLFKDKEQERCALCGKNYSVKTLATAHKKKRSECNEAERLDPYIVMPVCYMGCDYLYEHKYIYIENGIIKKGELMDHADYEGHFIKLLEGRRVDEQWLKGSKSYFEMPDNEC